MYGSGDMKRARVDYAVRAMARLATAPSGTLTKAEQIADLEEIPARFLLSILGELKRADLVQSRRGAEGGFALSRPADAITLVDIVCAVDDLDGIGAAPALPADDALGEVWVAVRAHTRDTLASVTLADLVSGTLPVSVRTLMAYPAR
jgi:Rrf2 family protein